MSGLLGMILLDIISIASGRVGQWSGYELTKGNKIRLWMSKQLIQKQDLSLPEQ